MSTNNLYPDDSLRVDPHDPQSMRRPGWTVQPAQPR